tara:strand:+ start:37 stop:555 length:519 start_codon:yes stop_codon:yes gene_type:complete
MAKKRIKKFLKKALPLLAIAGMGKAFLANRNRNAMINSADANDGFVDTVSTGKTIQDNMPTGIDKTITNVTNPNLSRMTGSGPNSGLAGQNIRANYARKMRNIAADRNRNDMLRAIRSNVDMATTPDSILQGVPEAALMAKDGGRIVKGEKVAKRKKKKSIQIRGFGKARRG